MVKSKLLIGTLLLAHCINLYSVKKDSQSTAQERHDASLKNACKTGFHNAAINNAPTNLLSILKENSNWLNSLELYSGDTALHKAAYYNCPHAAYALLKAEAQIRYKQPYKEYQHCFENVPPIYRQTYTPVYTAVLKRSTAVIALLYYICGDEDLFNAPNKLTGLTPEDLAQKKWNKSIKDLAIEGRDKLKVAFKLTSDHILDDHFTGIKIKRLKAQIRAIEEKEEQIKKIEAGISSQVKMFEELSKKK